LAAEYNFYTLQLTSFICTNSTINCHCQGIRTCIRPYVYHS